ncbi:MAG: hypothetical protein J6N77_04525 [Lachnospiraceae bacterium]|nr:hypothetical protein [Lachnospiraceae bacterium]
MNKIINKTILRPVLIAALAITLVAGAGIGTAWAYFTTYATMKGGVTLALGDTTEIKEKVTGAEKTVVISADSKSQPVYVRVKAFCGDAYSLVFTPQTEGEKTWTKGEDDYYNYSVPVGANEATTELNISIRGADGEPVKVTEDTKVGDGFNVVVIYETVPVTYNEDGSPKPADWTSKVTVQSTKGGN